VHVPITQCRLALQFEKKIKLADFIYFNYFYFDQLLKEMNIYFMVFLANFVKIREVYIISAFKVSL